MRKEIFMDVNPYQTRVVLVEDGELAEIYTENCGREKLVGNIYKGKVQNVLPGMQAAFVDIGIDKNAFLYAGDILADKADFEFPGPETKDEDITSSAEGREHNTGYEIKFDPSNIKDIVKPGQDIMVQVLKEPIGTKGCRVTTHITLPGRTLVLMPTVNYVGVSRRIADEKERERLREILEEVKPKSMGVIVRTAAEGKTREDFENDIKLLVRVWEKIQQMGKTLSGPRLIHTDWQLIFRTVRDSLTTEIDRLIINDKESYEKVLLVAEAISPELKEKVELYTQEDDLFEYYNLNAKIEKCLERKVWLKNGAYIVIDQTEALTTIDVNTGKYVGSNNLEQTITDTNCEAAREVAHQIRVRDISGIIIIDFIDMDNNSNKEKVLDALKEELQKDRTKSNVLGITALGLVEMTRKKMRNNLASTLQATCPYCDGNERVFSNETMALKIRRHLLGLFKNGIGYSYLISANPKVVGFFEDRMHSDKALIEKANGQHIYMRGIENMHIEEYSLQVITTRELEGMNGGITRLI